MIEKLLKIFKIILFIISIVFLITSLVNSDYTQAIFWLLLIVFTYMSYCITG